MNLEKYLKYQIRYYAKTIKNQSKTQDERYINYICGKHHAFIACLNVLKEEQKCQKI